MLRRFEQSWLSTQFNEFESIQEAVFESLKKAILAKHFSLGERLFEQQLAEIYSVSRTPIRQALKKLKREGLVEYVEKQGIIVSYLTYKDVEEIFRLRNVIENLLLGYAIKNANQKHLDRIYCEIQTSEELYELGQLSKVKVSFENLHKYIAELADMPRTAMMLDQLMSCMSRFREVSLEHPNRGADAIQEHYRIVYALRKQKVSEVQQQNRLHLNNAKEIIMLCSFN